MKYLVLIFILFMLFSCKKQDGLDDNKSNANTLEITYETITEITGPGQDDSSFISIYPNPFQKEVCFRIKNYIVPEKVVFSDDNGRMKSFIPLSSEFMFDFTSAKDGVYLCELLLNGTVHRFQLIKKEE